MVKVAALYRYPIKGFTPERAGELVLTGDNRVLGDRVLAFRYPRGTEPASDEGRDYWDKGLGLQLRDYPTLARLRLKYDDGRVNLTLDDGTLIVDALAPEEGWEITRAVTDYLASTTDARRLSRQNQQPVTLIGDGKTPRFQDRSYGFLSAHNRASVQALGEVAGMELDEVRFRSNIALDGLDAWEENDLIGSQIQIGDTIFDVYAPIVRCLAIQANPETGIRDASLMKMLTRDFEFPKPTFGVLLLPAARGEDEGAVIHVGDTVTAARQEAKSASFTTAEVDEEGPLPLPLED